MEIQSDGTSSTGVEPFGRLDTLKAERKLAREHTWQISRHVGSGDCSVYLGALRCIYTLERVSGYVISRCRQRTFQQKYHQDGLGHGYSDPGRRRESLKCHRHRTRLSLNRPGVALALGRDTIASFPAADDTTLDILSPAA